MMRYIYFSAVLLLVILMISECSSTSIHDLNDGKHLSSSETVTPAASSTTPSTTNPTSSSAYPVASSTVQSSSSTLSITTATVTNFSTITTISAITTSDIHISAPSAQTCIAASSFNVSGSAVDASGITQIAVSINGTMGPFNHLATLTGTGPEYSWTVNVSPSGSSNSVLSLAAQATSVSGSLFHSNVVPVLFNDTISPTGGFISPSSSGCYSSNLYIDGSISDNLVVDHVDIYIDGSFEGAASLYYSSGHKFYYTVTGLTSGTYSIDALIVDSCGNSVTINRTCTINLANHALEITTPPPNLTISGCNPPSNLSGTYSLSAGFTIQTMTYSIAWNDRDPIPYSASSSGNFNFPMDYVIPPPAADIDVMLRDQCWNTTFDTTHVTVTDGIHIDLGWSPTADLDLIAYIPDGSTRLAVSFSHSQHTYADHSTVVYFHQESVGGLPQAEWIGISCNAFVATSEMCNSIGNGANNNLIYLVALNWASDFITTPTNAELRIFDNNTLVNTAYITNADPYTGTSSINPRYWHVATINPCTKNVTMLGSSQNGFIDTVPGQ